MLMPKNNLVSVLVDKKLLDKIDKARKREPRSAFLYRLIDDALKTKPRRK